MRYFIIFYKFRFTSKSSFDNFGECSISSIGFPNRKKLLQAIKTVELQNTEVVFTNILEITEIDFNYWRAE